jgi:hypothetical protein
MGRGAAAEPSSELGDLIQEQRAGVGSPDQARRSSVAPENAPRRYSNSSLSARFGAIAPQLVRLAALAARQLVDRARRDLLAVLVSPRISRATSASRRVKVQTTSRSIPVS